MSPRPGRVCLLEYDDEAFAMESVEALCALYARRVASDGHGDVALLGRGAGALLCSLVATQLKAKVVILDSEAKVCLGRELSA